MSSSGLTSLENSAGQVKNKKPPQHNLKFLTACGITQGWFQRLFSPVIVIFSTKTYRIEPQQELLACPLECCLWSNDTPYHLLIRCASCISTQWRIPLIYFGQLVWSSSFYSAITTWLWRFVNSERKPSQSCDGLYRDDVFRHRQDLHKVYLEILQNIRLPNGWFCSNCWYFSSILLYSYSPIILSIKIEHRILNIEHFPEATKIKKGRTQGDLSFLIVAPPIILPPPSYAVSRMFMPQYSQLQILHTFFLYLHQVHVIFQWYFIQSSQRNTILITNPSNSFVFKHPELRLRRN